MAMKKDALSYLPGDVVVSRFRVKGVLGRGAFGAVYAAEHLGTGQPVAVKMLTADDDDERSIERFYREARITAALTHPNTVRVFDLGRDGTDGPLFLVMELLRGPDLEAVLRRLTDERRVMSELEAIDLMLPVLRSLTEAHKAGLVHRDLKPANLMLHCPPTGTPVIKVLDFGCSHTVGSELTGDGNSVGTPAYMSPEQARGESVTSAADLYAVAVMLYRCVTGRLPFEDTSPLALMFKHANELPPDPRVVSPRPVSEAMAQVVMRGLGKQPDDRFRDAPAMAEALDAVRKLQPYADAKPSEAVLGDLVRFILSKPTTQATDDPAAAPTGGRTQAYGTRMPSSVDGPTVAQEHGQVVTPTPPAPGPVIPPAAAPAAPQSTAPRGLLWLAGALTVSALLLGIVMIAAREPAAAPPAPVVAAPAAAPPAVAPDSTRADLIAKAQELAASAKTAPPARALILLEQALALDPTNVTISDQLVELRVRDAEARAQARTTGSAAPTPPAETRPRTPAAPHVRAKPAANEPAAAPPAANPNLQPRMME